MAKRSPEKKSPARELEPLVCSHCGAPQPVGDADVVSCKGCGKDTPLPEAYRHLRDAKRMSANDAAQLDALVKDIATPPPTWERVAMVVGYIVGGLTVIVMAIGAVIGAIGGFVVADKFGGGDTVAKFFVAVGVVLCGFVSVPFVGEWVVAFATANLDLQAASNALVGHTHFGTDLCVAGVLYFLGVVPLAVAIRTTSSISNLEALQAKLSAQPAASAGGVSACRRCGAPLDVRPGALATRCLYCNADNLLSVPKAFAKKKKDDATAIDLQVQAAIQERARSKRDDRKTMWTLLAAGILLAPLVVAGGWLLHKLTG